MHTQRQKISIHLSIPVGHANGYVYSISVHWVSSTIAQDDFSVYHHTYLVYAVPIYSWDMYEYNVTDRNLTSLDRLGSLSIHPPSLTYDSLLSDIVESRDSSLVLYTDHLSISPDRSTRVSSSSSRVHNYSSLSDLPISNSANEYIPIRQDPGHPIDLRSSRHNIAAQDRHAFDAISNNSYITSRPILISGARNFNPVSEIDYSGSNAPDSRNRIESSALSANNDAMHRYQSANENERTNFFHDNTVYGPTEQTMRQTQSSNFINVTILGRPEEINDRHMQVFTLDMMEPYRTSILFENFANNEPNHLRDDSFHSSIAESPFNENKKHDSELSDIYQKNNKQEQNIQNNTRFHNTGGQLGYNSDCSNTTPINWANNLLRIAGSEALPLDARGIHRSIPFQERPRPPEMFDKVQVGAASTLDQKPGHVNLKEKRSIINALQTNSFSKKGIDKAIQYYIDKKGHDNYSFDDLLEILTSFGLEDNESDNDSV